ncbi:hypothetical protein M527_07250 [Sphingobium indicum IP26]|uniref:Uncharacterized protein n=1 Tax=Sphingobium indicum F2 TaxID=1450518 RepID=A0A8E0WT43_9SPHN|nr:MULTISPECIES: hypothetical protein [Sphingobium]EPR09913.1 hypothetical protein M527_07250 [Sphingobium indicum IP26]EQB05041.1 hypothetical protein L286_09765 [Sphingobium sp. HDIP04]KER36705.1 hypothetical protein AL00_09545 [Sphingobium indicum F2]
MRRISIIWHDQVRGTVPVASGIRPPISPEDLAAIPAGLFIRSRSWLFDVRPGDFVFELRRVNGRPDVVIVASHKLGPGDIGCIVGFEPAEMEDICVPDEEMLGLADRIAEGLRKDGL